MFKYVLIFCMTSYEWLLSLLFCWQDEYQEVQKLAPRESSDYIYG